MGWFEAQIEGSGEGRGREGEQWWIDGSHEGIGIGKVGIGDGS